MDIPSVGFRKPWYLGAMHFRPKRYDEAFKLHVALDLVFHFGDRQYEFISLALVTFSRPTFGQAYRWSTLPSWCLRVWHMSCSKGLLLGRRSIRALDEGRSCLHCRLSLFSVLNVQAATIPIFFFRDLSLVLPLLGADDGHSNLAGEVLARVVPALPLRDGNPSC